MKKHSIFIQLIKWHITVNPDISNQFIFPQTVLEQKYILFSTGFFFMWINIGI